MVIGDYIFIFIICEILNTVSDIKYIENYIIYICFAYNYVIMCMLLRFYLKRIKR